MRRYAAVVLVVLATLLAVFVAVTAFDVALLEEPKRRLDRPSAGAAALGVTLLVVDAVVPVASSLVMVIHGALFGVVTGTALSVTGATGGTVVGFAIGRWGGTVLERIVDPGDRLRAARLIDRWGMTAVVVTRPVPLLAEAVAILAGAARLPWGRATAAAVLGSLPPALVYAVAGRTAHDAGVRPSLLVAAIAGCAVVATVTRLGEKRRAPTGEMDAA